MSSGSCITLRIRKANPSATLSVSLIVCATMNLSEPIVPWTKCDESHGTNPENGAWVARTMKPRDPRSTGNSRVPVCAISSRALPSRPKNGACLA